MAVGTAILISAVVLLVPLFLPVPLLSYAVTLPVLCCSVLRRCFHLCYTQRLLCCQLRVVLRGASLVPCSTPQLEGVQGQQMSLALQL